MNILIIGESCADIYTYGYSSRLSPEAPVPVFQPLYTNIYGGMAMNVYENVKSLGVKADIITNDNWRDITKLRYIDDKSNHMFLRIDENDNMYGIFNLDQIKSIIKNYDAVIISDYNKGFLTEEHILSISELHDVVFLDTKKQLGEWSKKVKYIKINNFEYEQTKHLIDNDLYDILIITMGEKGCKYKNKSYPVPKVDVKNTCGAGDTFISALTYNFILTKDIEKSIAFANEFATQVIQNHGPIHTKTVNK
jgi:D-beta-D-heptose 7-phosphate kinase/D-beta-D-heptose 1-phosphate adenosyltransferase